MPRKRKSNLSRDSKRARKARGARSKESYVQAELRRHKQAKRQSALRAGESSSTKQERLESQDKSQDTLTASEILFQSKYRLREAALQEAIRAKQTPKQLQAKRVVNTKGGKADCRILGIIDYYLWISKQAKSQVIRNICKEVDQISRRIATVLQVIHHNEADIGPACLQARELLEKSREGYGRLKQAVPATDYYKYQDHWRYTTQRYCFLISLTIWLEKGILAQHETVADILGISAVEEKEGFHLDIEDYLVGLLNLCSELSRLAVNSVTRGDYEKPLQISKFVMELNAGFRLLNLKNDHLRKRFDALKYEVKKIEEVVYDLSIRGLLPKFEAVDINE